jgi:hypothetical protein
MSYDMIERFLRNNLDDDDYKEYSAALDELCTPKPCQTCEALARTVMLDQTSHDTKREWVGLTLNELLEIHNRKAWDFDTSWEYEQAIEAKLKELNT